jgi:DNA-directed RNA polymerase subunit K/omega
MSGFKPRSKVITTNKQMSKIEEQEIEYAGSADSDFEENNEDEEEEEEEDEEDEEEDASSEEDEEDEEDTEDADAETGLMGGSKEGNDDSDDDDIPAVANSTTINPLAPVLDSDDEDEDEMDESYLQKFNTSVNKNYILDFHPECVINNYDEIVGLTKIVRDSDNNIIDDLHKTLPYLTKYERARVLGQRAKQINAGAKVFVKVPENIIDGYLIAELELAQKRIPFIIRRPTPGGGCEYWNLKDLELIQF